MLSGCGNSGKREEKTVKMNIINCSVPNIVNNN